MALRIFARINTMWLMLFFAILLGGIATWLAVNYLRSSEARIQAEIEARSKGGPTTQVIVPVQNLPRGTLISDKVVAGRPVANDLVYDETILVDHYAEIAGRRLLRDVQQGRPLRRGDLFDLRAKDFSDEIEPGLRAITLETDELNSISQMLRPGNFVDLYLIAAEQGGTGQQVLPLLERVKVVATGQDLKREEGQAPPPRPAGQLGIEVAYSTVTVEVTPTEAARIALAQQSGRIRAVLRNTRDDEGGDIGQVNTASLFSLPSEKGGGGPAAAKKVEFIIGGQGSGGTQTPININIPSVTIPGLPPQSGTPAKPAATTGAPQVPGVPPGAQIQGLPAAPAAGR